MTVWFLAVDPDSGGQVEQIARTFGVDWPHLIAQTISFSIVCALLYWLAYRPVLRMLEARRQQIAHGLANAEKIRAELAKTEAQRQEVLAQAHAQAKTIVQDARAAAARVEAQETQRAVAAAEDIVAKAHEAAERERAPPGADSPVRLERRPGSGARRPGSHHRRLAEETARQLSA